MSPAKPASLAASLLLFAGLAAFAQQPPPEEKKPEAQPQAPISDQLPKREVPKKEREKQEKELRKELGSHYKSWLDEEVAYIITPEEKEAFLRLGTDEEREQFIEQFWLRRDPTPDTPENENREEHYRRIAYANERFSSGKPGWRTDRGRIYIAWGPPDEIESHPSGGAYYREPSEGGGGTSTYPFERWRYRYLEGIGEQIILEFVDPSFSGEYRLTIDPSEKDALLNVPNAGLSMLEEMGLADKGSRFDRTDGTHMPTRLNELGRSGGTTGTTDMFERLRILAAVMKPPEVKFKDLEELVRTRISFNLLPFETRTDFLRVTDDTSLVPITISVRKRDVTFKFENGIHRSVVNVFGRVTTMTGRVVQTFEDILSVDVPASLFEQTLDQPTVYQKALPLRSGLYKLNLVLKDINSGNIGTLEQRIAVPQFEEGKLAHSTLILADQIERVATKSVGSGQFVIGDTKVRPAVPEDFSRSERLGIYLQVYNLSVSEQTHKPDLLVEYTVQKGSETVFAHSETTDQIPRAGQQVTLEKVLPLTNFEPGEYTLAIHITDQLNHQSVSPTATFRVTR